MSGPHRELMSSPVAGGRRAVREVGRIKMRWDVTAVPLESPSHGQQHPPSAVSHRLEPACQPAPAIV